MSNKNYQILEQNENGWKMTRIRMKYRRLKKRRWSKLNRKSEYKIPFKGYEF